jgi:hypothetical protein
MRYGHTLPERLNYFSELFLNPVQNSIGKWDVPIGGIFQQIEIYKVPIELPKYRLDNTRTLHLQEQYIFENNLSGDYFTDIESDKIQEIQHNFLLKLIRSTDKERDLPTYFSKTDQTEPLILTSDGFVISGNRRLCTYRYLLEDDFEKNKRYSLIRVAILPKLSTEQIDLIEDYLEQQTDIKEHFSWVSRALGYRRRMQRFGYSHKKLAQLTDQKEKTLESLINRLEIADRYLDSIGKQKNYDLIIKDEFAFEEMYKCLSKGKSNPIHKTAFEKLSFLAIKNKESFSDRMYNNIPLIYEAQTLIHNELEDIFEEELVKIKNESKITNDFIEEGEVLDPTISIIKLFEKPDLEKRILDVVTDKITEVIETEKEKKRKSSVSDCLTKVQKWIVQANFFANHETDKTGLLEQLDVIEKEITKLKVWINKK